MVKNKDVHIRWVCKARYKRQNSHAVERKRIPSSFVIKCAKHSWNKTICMVRPVLIKCNYTVIQVTASSTIVSMICIGKFVAVVKLNRQEVIIFIGGIYTVENFVQY